MYLVIPSGNQNRCVEKQTRKKLNNYRKRYYKATIRNSRNSLKRDLKRLVLKR